VDPAGEGLGGLLTSDVEHVELGQVGARVLRARVQRRQLRLGAGRGAGMRITIGRLRPVAVEVTAPDGTYEVPIPPVGDPWLAAIRRLALLGAASLAIRWWVRRRRGRTPAARLD
jgi:hypothetical protein